MQYQPVGISAGAVSYDVEPADHLDPDLFDGDRMNPGMRAHLLSLLSSFMAPRFQGVNHWMRAWVAGSGASYRWYATEDPRDLDILIGIDFSEFRRANVAFANVSDLEIAKNINDGLRKDLWPETAHWLDNKYEVTWYVNPKSWDITRISPYAAYNLIDNEWTVRPTKSPSEVNPAWPGQAELYRQRAEWAVARYSQALTEVRNATNPSHRIDAERRLNDAIDQSVSIYEIVHRNRRLAFSPVGEGYGDWHNYLWQAGKRDGWLTALRQIKDYQSAVMAEQHKQTYGVELPDPDLLVRRAAMRYKF